MVVLLYNKLLGTSFSPKKCNDAIVSAFGGIIDFFEGSQDVSNTQAKKNTRELNLYKCIFRFEGQSCENSLNVF